MNGRGFEDRTTVTQTKEVQERQPVRRWGIILPLAGVGLAVTAALTGCASKTEAITTTGAETSIPAETTPDTSPIPSSEAETGSAPSELNPDNPESFRMTTEEYPTVNEAVRGFMERLGAISRTSLDQTERSILMTENPDTDVGSLFASEVAGKAKAALRYTFGDTGFNDPNNSIVIETISSAAGQTYLHNKPAQTLEESGLSGASFLRSTLNADNITTTDDGSVNFVMTVDRAYTGGSHYDNITYPNCRLILTNEDGIWVIGSWNPGKSS